MAHDPITLLSVERKTTDAFIDAICLAKKALYAPHLHASRLEVVPKQSTTVVPPLP